jgi:hypothetical protein
MTATEQALPGEPGPIAVPLDRYRARLTGVVWPAALPNRGRLWRRDVFAVADAWRTGSSTSRDLALATILWGFGPTQYGPYRAAQILAADPDGHRLDVGLAFVRGNSPTVDQLRAAYVAFCPRQPAHVRGLGPAFFTKLLYFAGYRRRQGAVQPLILHAVVAGRLPEAAGPARRRKWGWRSAEWVEYLRWAADEAARPRFGGEPDEVEMALFAGRWTADAGC